jgi:hypothetical protein
MCLERISARRYSLPQIAQEICELTLNAAFVHVMVPAAAVQEGNFEADVRFEQFRDFHQTLPEAILGIFRGVFGLILVRIDFLRLSHHSRRWHVTGGLQQLGADFWL